ncbi:MAG: hypothetical protein ABR878_17185 [Roseiarcus sp.]|jgi:hypothetical protein
MHALWPSSAFLLIATSSAGLAASATSDGAKAIEQGYVDFFTKAVVDQGIVSVATDGDDYVVVWDLQKALDLAGSPKGALRIESFSYTLTPGDEGSWTVKADRFPSLAFDVPTDKGKVTGTLDFSGFRLETAYDAAQTSFLRSLVAADSLAAKFHVADAAQGADFDLLESGISVETSAKTSDSGAGVDVAVAQSVKSLSETIVAAPPSGQGPPVNVTYSIGGVVGGATISGLRAREIGDFWKYLVAHIEDSDVPPELKPRLQATLPLWNSLQTNAEIHDLTLHAPKVDATLKTLGETIGLSGFTADGDAEVGVKIDELAFKSPLLPPWAEQLSPVSFHFDLRVADKGLDQVAKLALDDPSFGRKGELSPEAQDKISEVLLRGRPKVTLSPGRFTTPMLDLAFEGEASAESGAPSGHFTFSADGLDKTIALLEDAAKTEPDLQSAALGVTFIKGLATTGADGRLVWKVDVTAAGEVTVNGAPLPTGK